MYFGIRTAFLLFGFGCKGLLREGTNLRVKPKLGLTQHGFGGRATYRTGVDPAELLADLERGGRKLRRGKEDQGSEEKNAVTPLL
jgi:hypothetical protein